jgi:dolichyl-diphosphooligosaccharide--protein glycosyltransferase
LYPGLMVTSAIIHKVLRLINLPVDIRNVCVLLAPGFSGLTALATYLFTREMNGDGAGLLAAAFIGIAPGMCPFYLVVLMGRIYFAECGWIVRQ